MCLNSPVKVQFSSSSSSPEASCSSPVHRLQTTADDVWHIHFCREIYTINNYSTSLDGSINHAGNASSNVLTYIVYRCIHPPQLYIYRHRIMGEIQRKQEAIANKESVIPYL